MAGRDGYISSSQPVALPPYVKAMFRNKTGRARQPLPPRRFSFILPDVDDLSKSPLAQVINVAGGQGQIISPTPRIHDVSLEMIQDGSVPVAISNTRSGSDDEEDDASDSERDDCAAVHDDRMNEADESDEEQENENVQQEEEDEEENAEEEEEGEYRTTDEINGRQEEVADSEDEQIEEENNGEINTNCRQSEGEDNEQINANDGQMEVQENEGVNTDHDRQSKVSEDDAEMEEENYKETDDYNDDGQSEEEMEDGTREESRSKERNEDLEEESDTPSPSNRISQSEMDRNIRKETTEESNVEEDEYTGKRAKRTKLFRTNKKQNRKEDSHHNTEPETDDTSRELRRSNRISATARGSNTSITTRGSGSTVVQYDEIPTSTAPLSKKRKSSRSVRTEEGATYQSPSVNYTMVNTPDVMAQMSGPVIGRTRPRRKDKGAPPAVPQIPEGSSAEEDGNEATEGRDGPVTPVAPLHGDQEQEEDDNSPDTATLLRQARENDVLTYRLWCGEDENYKKRTARDITDLDVVLNHFEEITMEFRNEVEDPVCRKAINKFARDVQSELQKTIEEVSALKSLQLEFRRSERLLKKKRDELCGLQNRRQELRKHLAQLRKKKRQQQQQQQQHTEAAGATTT